MEEQHSDEELADDDPLLRAVAWAPRASGALGDVAVPEALRVHLGAQAPVRSALPSPGDVIDGRYRIDGKLGAGGMGVVFSATHLQMGKPVALKWMQQHQLTHDQALTRRRFEREARIAARVRHPNVVDVYDASCDDDRSYLAMELLTGETLSARVRRAPLSWPEAISLFAPILRGVSALHAHGVLHRDLKPDNIFLSRTEAGAEPCPKVLDFGVASLRVSESDTGEPSLTHAGSALGTPCYMPLEQLRGERDLDMRTDVYALGVVLYEALCGRRPIVAGNAAEHAALIASEGPRPLVELVPALRGARADAVMKALAREPRDRHASVDVFLSALLRADHARPRHRRVAVVAAVALVAAAVVAALYSRAPESPVPTRAARQTHAAAPSRLQPRPEQTPAAPHPSPVLPTLPPPSSLDVPHESATAPTPPQTRTTPAARRRADAVHLPQPRPEPRQAMPAADPNIALSRDDF